MKLLLVSLFLAACTSLALAEEPRQNRNEPLSQAEGMPQKPYRSGDPLPKYCTAEEWRTAIEATVAATRDIPVGSTAEFVARANQVAARFGC